jgi:outer membrane protein assembly factor BamB
VEIRVLSKNSPVEKKGMILMKMNGWLVLGCLVAGSVMAADWPQFCGPNRNNVSEETGLADTWPADGPKVLWETAVHDGYSGPSIKGGKAYFIDRDGDSSLLRCLDMTSGQDLWTVSIHDPGVMKGKKFEGTRGTPTVTDDAIYLVTGYGTLACIDLKTKKVLWKHQLLEEYGIELHQFGIAQSPSIYKNMVLVAPNAPDFGVAAYDKKTGKLIWKSKGLGFHSYICPRVEQVCGVDMVIAVGSSEKAPRPSRRKKEDDEPEPVKKELAPGHVVGLSVQDGSILWDYTNWRCHMAIPHPVALSDNRFFITSGYDAGSALIQIRKDSSGFAFEEIYKTDEVGAQLHQPIQVGDYLFVGSTSNSRKDGLASFALDGTLLWRTKDIDDAPRFERSPFLMADGKLIALDAKSGTLYLLKADPLNYTEISSAVLLKENEMSWAPMALSDGKLLLRDWDTMKCVDLR